jgi:hypothetical protein
MTCYACDNDPTGTCNRTHSQGGVVPACERHRDDHAEPPSDGLVKELVVQGRIASLQSDAPEPWLVLDYGAHGAEEAATAASLAEHRDGPVCTPAEELALALYALDQTGVSRSTQLDICKLIALDLGDSFGRKG